MLGKPGIEPSKYVELKDFSSLIAKNKTYVISEEDSEKQDYFSSKEKALSAINQGYDILPKIYHAAFVTPLKEFVDRSFDSILTNIKSKGSDIPYRDWIDSIQQRKEGYLRLSSHAFNAVIDDLYAGWLDSESRFGIKPPDNQTVPPLPRWGYPKVGSDIGGPYTIAVTQSALREYGIRISVVTMGPTLSRNISVWGALAHECGHDIVLADNGLLAECTHHVYSQISQAPELQNQTINYNGNDVPFGPRAAELYKFWINEIVADVMSVLNFGPAAGISSAAYLIPLRNGKLSNTGLANDRHPIDALRLFLIADLIREITSLNIDIRKTWSDTIEKIISKYIVDNSRFVIGYPTQEGFQPTQELPFGPMRETTRIVAKTLAYAHLETLEKHYLAEINTWSDTDEWLAVSIADELLNSEEPCLESRTEEEKIYAAHLVAGSIYALAESADISGITDLAFSALNKVYDNNAIWGGFNFDQTADFFIHSFAPSLKHTAYDV
jgi:hypothetical protein